MPRFHITEGPYVGNPVAEWGLSETELRLLVLIVMELGSSEEVLPGKELLAEVMAWLRPERFTGMMVDDLEEVYEWCVAHPDETDVVARWSSIMA